MASSSSSYAQDPNHTPITSIKRPRSSRNLRMPSSSSLTTNEEDEIHNDTDDNTNNNTSPSMTMSPMHGVKPISTRTYPAIMKEEKIAETVEEIFSPVAHFLDHPDPSSSSDDEEEASLGSPSSHHPHGVADDEFNPWQFIANLPSYESVRSLLPPVSLPPPSSFPNNNHLLRKTLVLDLDETLVHCSVDPPPDGSTADLTFPVFFHGLTYTVHVKLRPYLYKFLQSVREHFEVIVFTASQKVYANALLDLIDPESKYIDHRLFRESCLAVEGNFLKDLNVLGRDLRTTVLVDNSPHAFGYQVDNGIPIESWFDDVHDRELLKLAKFLKSHIVPADDVRTPIRRRFQNHVWIENAPPLY